MYKLLIVDDEDQIREGLRRILAWEDYNIEICGEASDGLEAVQIIEQKKPHIVLTDIKMTGMNGISLLKEVRDRQLKSKVIVLSGYDDYELVRQAMRYGAVDYLLKPAGKSELIQIIEELIDQLEDKAPHAQDSSANMEAAKSMLLNRVITNSISAMEFHEKMELLEMSFGSEPMAVARIEFLENPSDLKNAFYRIGEALTFCRTFLESRSRGVAFTNTAGYVVCILTGMNEHEMTLGCREELEELLEELSLHTGQEMFMSVSRPVKSYRDLGRAYHEAEDTLKYKFIFDTGKILYTGEIDAYFVKNEVTDYIIDQKRIEAIVLEDKQKEIALYVEEIFGEARVKKCYIDYYVLKNMGMEIIIYLFNFLLSQNMLDRKAVLEQKEAALKQLMELKNLNAMKQLLQTCIEKVNQQYHEKNAASYGKIVCDTIYQIKESYADINLSLQYLADRFGVNAAYLGRIFKKETGSSFIDYLNLYRIDEAKRLLRETNLKGSELCKKVGFSNYNYFYIVFKKITGKKPMEIRNTSM